MELDKLPTYVFIDTSNIRAACLKSCNIKIDFFRLLDYFRQKYPQLNDVRFYEGIAKGDTKKQETFRLLSEFGYTICGLQRMSYTDMPIVKKFFCKKCGHQNRVTIVSKVKKMKSNVDVYLATEMLDVAYHAKKPMHIILLSCDGDYAEAIKSSVNNKNVFVTVLATPPKKDIKINTLSIRLKKLRSEIPEQYQLSNIETIKKYITKKSGSEDTL